MINPSDNNGYVPPGEILDFFRIHRNFLILGHTEPDGDCLGSQLALAEFLISRGWSAQLYSPGPFSRPEIEELAPRFQKRIPDPQKNNPRGDTAVVVLDCSTPDRLGDLKDDIEGLPLCVIDHHASGTLFGDLRWVDSSCPAVTLMIQGLIESFEAPIESGTAGQLFFGLATDTGFFRHLSENGAPAFRSASRLIEAGASPKKTFARMYGNRPFSSRVLLGRMLERARPLSEGRLIYTWESLKDLEELGPAARDSDMLYQLLLGTRGCEAAAVIREEGPGRCSAGLRSLYDLDVGAIASGFGGGGHQKAAGFSFTGKREELELRLLPLLDKAMKSSG
ncbi:bifunctional oligoribonuclease/PAP phosphatase NrnA [Marispirochaeta aestuarii]|uniref:DHH family phosphoesterase n=1 Tax=Marispirochaeta aestuarii TaxID=1963862 RepID=UPI002ABE2DAF|nr:bifunctional oligoribonuclease/PAP phosphatase NrnA [Marispirochaeta aestuarii]